MSSVNNMRKLYLYGYLASWSIMYFNLYSNIKYENLKEVDVNKFQIFDYLYLWKEENNRLLANSIQIFYFIDCIILLSFSNIMRYRWERIVLNMIQLSVMIGIKDNKELMSMYLIFETFDLAYFFDLLSSINVGILKQLNSIYQGVREFKILSIIYLFFKFHQKIGLIKNVSENDNIINKPLMRCIFFALYVSYLLRFYDFYVEYITILKNLKKKTN